ncbi:MAG TPA: hypothetical protein VGI56_02885 [Galbitalea sp.]
MTDDSPVPLAQEVETGKHRANGWERALWIVGASLLVISAGLVYGFVEFVIAQDSSTPSSSDFGGIIAFTQTSSIYTPALVAAGIVCIALALFSRALDVNARQRDALRPIVIAPSAPDAGQQVVPPAPATPLPTASTDYAAFMRPGAAADTNK